MLGKAACRLQHWCSSGNYSSTALRLSGAHATQGPATALAFCQTFLLLEGMSLV